MLKILNINKYIIDNKIKVVTNVSSFTREGDPTPDGLYSELIFGITKKEQQETFGYINL